MPITFPTEEKLRRLWRRRLYRAQRQYAACRTKANQAEVKRALATFADLVLYGVKPTERSPQL
jgi:hypothetical protein